VECPPLQDAEGDQLLKVILGGDYNHQLMVVIVWLVSNSSSSSCQ